MKENGYTEKCKGSAHANGVMVLSIVETGSKASSKVTADLLMSMGLNTKANSRATNPGAKALKSFMMELFSEGPSKMDSFTGKATTSKSMALNIPASGTEMKSEERESRN